MKLPTMQFFTRNSNLSLALLLIALQEQSEQFSFRVFLVNTKINSLGPVYEFVYISFRTDNLNCFRVKLTMRINMLWVRNAESRTTCPKMTTPKYMCFCPSLTRQSNAYLTFWKDQDACHGHF